MTNSAPQYTDNKNNTDSIKNTENGKHNNDYENAQIKKEKRFNHIWWIPLIALFIVMYIGINHYASRGPLAMISFSSAEGIEVSKTKVKYKDVVIGKVESIKLNDNLKGVKVGVRINKDNENLLRKNTRFWVVKARLGITQISGLNTLLSGNYISIEPDSNKENDFRYEFTGLEKPPIINQNEPGLKITLLSNKANALYPGTSVYYKGITVGSVNRVYFSDDYQWVKADVFIASPHDKLIKNTTKFWATNGISVEGNPSGINVSIDSIEALIGGGITFETPISLSAQNTQSAKSGTEYVLFANKKAVENQVTGRKHYFVTYFRGSMKGLEVGSPVVLQGITVGKVQDIRLMFDTDMATTRVPVLFEIYEDRFNLINNENSDKNTDVDKKATDNTDNTNNTKETSNMFVEKLVAQGLKTQLETSNLLTGAKNIALILNPGGFYLTRNKVQKDPITGYTILSSTPQSFDALASGVTNVVNKINKLPLEQLAHNLNSLLEDTNEELNATLKEGRNLFKNTGKTLKSLNYSINKLAKTTASTLDSYSADAPLYHNLNQSLEQLNDTLTSLKSVSEMLDRSPNSLIFGKDQPQDPQQSYWGKDND